MATKRNVVDFKIHNLTEEQFQELKVQGKIDPNAVYCTPDTTKERLDALETKTDATNTALSQGLAQLEENKQDITTAVNYDNITNCITEIPQDIKLELNNGTLTLKAGSKVYVPNGAGVFDVVNIANDISNSGNTYKAVAVTDGSSLLWTNNVSSGGTAPANPSNGQIWYDTTNNVVKRYSTGSGTWVGGFSLPIALLNPNATTLTTITEMQMFNGFGYIGSTIFALPAVKGLIPKGRNEDGTLKNTEFTTGSVLTQTLTGGTFTRPVILTTNTLGFNAGASYDNKTNTVSTGNYMIVGTGSAIDGKITSFEPKSAFHAVGYNDLGYMLNNKANNDLSNTDFAALKNNNNKLIWNGKPVMTNSFLTTIAETIGLYSGGKGLTDYTDGGAWLKLCGSSSQSGTYENGSFQIGASLGANSKMIFIGKANGDLTWNGNRLATMPNYSAGVAFTLNKATPYTAPKDGVVFIHTGRANDQHSNIKIDGTVIADTISNWSNIPYFFPVAKGTVVSTDYDTISTAIFYPLKGAI